MNGEKVSWQDMLFLRPLIPFFNRYPYIIPRFSNILIIYFIVINVIIYFNTLHLKSFSDKSHRCNNL